MTRDLVLLCYGRNSPYDYDAHTPLSILALGTYLETKGVEVEYYDERLDALAVFDALLARGPLLVGFSVIGGYQIEASARLSRRVRAGAPGAAVVWGGITPTTLARETIQEDFVDFVVIGEGEETLWELILRLREGRPADGLLGLAHKAGGRPRCNPARPSPDVETLPFVYQGKALEMLKRYLLLPAVREAVGYEGSRGCPFLCTFCYSPNFHANVRVKSPAKVAAELKTLRSLGVDRIDIYDDTLMGGRKPEIALLAAALRETSMRWMANLRINMLSRELLSSLEGSGCEWLYYGIESDRDDVLAVIKKGMSASQIEEGLKLMGASSIPAVYSIIYGLPIDGPAPESGEVLAFAERIHELDPDAEVQVQSYVPLPGSDLYGSALARGFTPPADLMGWSRHDHLTVEDSWLADPRLPRKLYLSSFMAYRYRRHLSRFPLSLAAFPLHLLSRWRIRRRAFGFYIEGPLYRFFLAAARARSDLHFWLREKR
ncbi:MAG: B12-binding domain-containing radical SAM protein [Elusimicrobia bacterium]|nr:B12-binding domain-containing radical SAM protein [Elusimicrobiota bacterium]